MLVKQVKGRSFYNCLNYVLGKLGATRIGSNMFGKTTAELNQEFESLDDIRPRVTRRVYHCALSLPPEEHLSDATWRSLALDYLKEMGFEWHQYLLVRHTDTEHHEHVHLVVNRVGLDGKVTAESWDHYRAQKVARVLEQTYELKPTKSSWESERSALSYAQLDQELKTGLPSVQRQLQETIAALVPQCSDLPEVVEKLKEQSIATTIHYDSENQAIGLSYQKDQISFSGSALGRGYRLNGIRAKLPEMNGTFHSSEQIEMTRDRIQNGIAAVCHSNTTLPELIRQLQKLDIEVHLRYRRINRYQKSLKAISYRQEDIAFLSSAIGENYTISGLQTIFGMRYDPKRDDPWIHQWQRREVELTPIASIPDRILRVWIQGTGKTELPAEVNAETIAPVQRAIDQAYQTAIEQEYDRIQFISRLGLGFEQWGAAVALNIRETAQEDSIAPKVEVIAVTHPYQDLAWTFEQKQRYRRIIAAVDQVEFNPISSEETETQTYRIVESELLTTPTPSRNQLHL